MSYDSWLEAPYQRAAAQADAYVTWCEGEGLDPDDDHWQAFEEAMDDARYDAEVERGERQREEAMFEYE
jgi:hypothetical protein